jgi:cytochrome c oxidase cbb3-type subunit 3
MNREGQDQVRGHDFDGIEEYDNRLPNWWLFTLYGAVVFALIYWIFFHTSGLGTLSYGRYREEMARAAEIQLSKMSGEAPTDESLALVAAIPERVDAGREIFVQFCVTCHLADASGQVGPNLTDGYWLHGGKPTDILDTVTNGVLEKGMAAWGNQLGPRRVQDVVAYVLTIKGTNRPGKAPQGVLETPDAPEAQATPSAQSAAAPPSAPATEPESGM